MVAFLISHLCFVDDIIIFSDGVINMVKIIRQFLNLFEKECGLINNNNKISSIATKLMFISSINAIIDTTQFKYKKLLITYLGTSLFIGKKSHSFLMM